MADTLENMQEAHIRRSEKTESRSIEETNVNKKLDKNLLSVIQTCPDYVLNCDSQGRALGSMVKIMNKNVSVGHYDKTESILISQKKGDEDERQNSTESRPEKRAKTVRDSRERIEDLKKNVDIPENLSLDAQENVPEQIERQRREAQDKLKQQSNQQNMEQHRGVETKGRDVRSRLEQFYNRQRTKKQQFQAQQQQEMKHQQEQEPIQQQQQPLASHFQLYPLVEKLANAVETGTRDQTSDALVTELSSYLNKSQQLLNSLSGSKPMYVDGQKRKLEDSEKLLQQRRELVVEYRKSIEDILKIEP